MTGVQTCALPICKKNLKFKRSLKEGYGKYCSILCTNKSKEHIEQSKKIRNSKKEEILEKTKITNLKKFGVVNPFQDLELVRNGFLKKYGVDHVSKINGVSEKRRNTFLLRYGFSSNFVNPKSRNKNIKNKQENFISKYREYKFKNYLGKDLIIECVKCGLDYTINRSLFRHRTLYDKTPCTN